jgi:endoglucanase
MTLQTQGSRIVDAGGDPIRLRGTNIGGWLNMENFITGYAANESMMRAEMRKVLGDDRYELFFETLLTSFYGDADCAFLAGMGMNCVRVGLNYRHLESDMRPFEIIADGFRHLDRAIEAGGRHGIYSIIDLHALPGAQNQHWHSDNPTHRALFWEHRHFQDRVVGIWEAIAERYKDNPWVAGYGVMNEPAEETGEVVGPYYHRLAEAIREIDPAHILFLDGNTYSTDFSMFEEPLENSVYTLHDYVPAGLGRADHYPGAESAEEKFLERSEYARRTETPLYVGEFAPIYTGDEAVDAERRRILDDQLAIYRRYDAGFATWMYKDIGRQGLVYARPDTPYRQLVADFVAKKERLGVDQWGSSGRENPEITEPIQELVAREAPDFDPYPWGRFDWVRTLLLNITFAQPLAQEYARLFAGRSDEELVTLAESFRFENCAVRETLRDQLSAA